MDSTGHFVALSALVARLDAIDPETRLKLLHAIVDYGHARANESSDRIAAAWQASIDRHLGGRAA